MRVAGGSPPQMMCFGMRRREASFTLNNSRLELCSINASYSAQPTCQVGLDHREEKGMLGNYRAAVKQLVLDCTHNLLGTRWLPGFARVPYNAPSACHMHPIIIAIT